MSVGCIARREVRGGAWKPRADNWSVAAGICLSLVRRIAEDKWLGAVTFSWAGVELVILALWVVPEHPPLQRVGLRLDIGPDEIVGLVTLALPLCPALVALEMDVATLARSNEEAQSYVSFLMLLPMLPILKTMDAPLRTRALEPLCPRARPVRPDE